MTPEQENARRRRAVAAARSLLSLEHGLIYGSRRVVRALAHLGDEVPARFPVFATFLESIPRATPVGELRLLCTDALLFESDAILADRETKFRASVLRECQRVIKALHGDPAP